MMNNNKHINFEILAIPIFLVVFTIVVLCGKQVWAAGEILKKADIEGIGMDYMLNVLEWNPDRLEIKVVYKGKQIKIPKEEATVDCKLPGRKRRIGRVHFICMVKVNEIVTKRLLLYADIKVTYDIYRPTQSLKMGHIIQPGDIELTRVKSDHMLRNIIASDADIVGHRLTRNLERGEALQVHMLKRVPLVKNGDRILLIIKRGPLRVTVPGVVRQNGFKNDMVRVENIQSRKIVMGTVIDSRTVHINF